MYCPFAIEAPWWGLIPEQFVRGLMTAYKNHMRSVRLLTSYNTTDKMYEEWIQETIRRDSVFRALGAGWLSGVCMLELEEEALA